MKMYVDSCQVDACKKSRPYRKGYCGLHYQRWMKHGDVTKVLKVTNIRHDMVCSPEWQSWRGMKERCDNPNYKQSSDYKERGISYDPRWSMFLDFYADMGDRPEGMTLERIDNNKGYSKANCKWASYHDQRMNQRRMVNNVWYAIRQEDHYRKLWSR